MKPRILVILPLNGGSLIVGQHIADVLNEMEGAESEVIATQPLCDYYTRKFVHLAEKTERIKSIVQHINIEVIEKAVVFRPDLVLVMALAPITPWCIERIKQLGALTAHWYVENLEYFPANPVIPKWQIVAPFYDHFFTIQKNAFDHIKHSVRNLHYLPMGCNPSVQCRKTFKTRISTLAGSDISFVGHPYPNRVALFRLLQEFAVTLWGPGWREIPELMHCAGGNGKWIDRFEEVEIIRCSKIGLNIHSTLDGNTLIKKGYFLNPRVFTIAACGTFQLVDEQDGLQEVFETGKEIATYSDVTDLKAQLIHFLKNEKERKNMAEKAQKRAIGEHTYGNRLREILKVTHLN